MSWTGCCFDWDAADAEENESYSLVTGIFLNKSMCCRYKEIKDCLLNLNCQAKPLEVEVIQKDQVKKKTPDKAWIQALSETFCASHGSIHFFRSHVALMVL